MPKTIPAATSPQLSPMWGILSVSGAPVACSTIATIAAVAEAATRPTSLRGRRLFTSSLAVFGSDPAIGPVGPVDDDTLPRPQSSYGIQKFVGEQLVADYTRKDSTKFWLNTLLALSMAFTLVLGTYVLLTFDATIS